MIPAELREIMRFTLRSKDKLTAIAEVAVLPFS